MQIGIKNRESTIVTFAGGSLLENATLIAAERVDHRWIIVTDRTPFHPVSRSWPDQPGDRGTLIVAGERYPVVDSRTAFIDPETGLADVGAAAAPPDRSKSGFCAIVLHIVEANDDLATYIGQSVQLEVDGKLRDCLSTQHTGIHLAALMLNQTVAAYWTKEYPDRDSLGAANFDKAAVTRSEIGEDKSIDHYRIGKSLRKKGFDRDSFLRALSDTQNLMNAQLVSVLADAGPVALVPAEGPLDERRSWSTCVLGRKAEIPCGGTHLDDVGKLSAVTVELTTSDDGFIMTTRSEPKLPQL